MKCISKKFVIFTILIFLFISNFGFNVQSREENVDMAIDDLAYRQEIDIPFDTTSLRAKNQPIDIEVEFENQCWAQDESVHSIRVAYEKGSSIVELESQIYDLHFSGENRIDRCSLVFLIPQDADGSEEYFVLYDDKEQTSPEYEDHLDIVDTHYFYEPISGQKIDVDYYGVWDSGNVIYGVVQTGELLGNPISFAVLKFKPESKKVETYNIDQLGVFDIRYGTDEQPGYIGTSWAEKVKKTVLVDGNLMVRVRLEGLSPSGDLKTDNIYTYYHSPEQTRRIFINSNHEVLEDIHVEEPSLLDGTYCGIVSIKARSATIEKMNVGDILASISMYTENNLVESYDVPLNPSTVEREVILSTQDDIDLGERAWICSSDPDTGKAHGIIFDSNEGINQQEDGIQVKSWVKENIKLPGLEADTSNLYAARNSYEMGGTHNKNPKKGFTAKFRAVFATVSEDGADAIDEESQIYQKLIKTVPVIRENVTGEKEAERFNLKCFVHMAPSMPLGSLLSAATGKKIPYIYAELYRDNSFLSAGSVGRLALGSVEFDMEGKNLIEKIQTITGIFDIKNSSFFKKIVFPALTTGVYIVKIFRENPFFGDERKFIGFGIVNVSENSSMRVFCSMQSAASFTVVNQNQEGIANVLFQLGYNDVIIGDGVSDENGSVFLTAPAKPLKPYDFKALYQGFLIADEPVKMGFINNFRPVKGSYTIDLYDLKVYVEDLWGFTPEVDLNPKVTSEEMHTPVFIAGEKINRGQYFFNDLKSAGYSLFLRYKSFETEEKIDLDGGMQLDLVFPAEYKVSLNFFNSLGMQDIEKGEVFVSRSGKTISSDIDNSGKSIFVVPPGEYKISVEVDDETVAEQNLVVKSSKTIDLVTKKGSTAHDVVMVISILLIVAAFLYIFWKKEIYSSLKIVVIAILLLSLFSPWWVLTGEQGEVSTSTMTYLYPSNMVTFTQSSDAMGGSVSLLPEDFTMVLTLLSLLLLISIILSVVTIFTKTRFRKTTIVLSVICVVLLVVCMGLFYYAMSMVTEIGVGSFSGSDKLFITVPGQAEGVNIPCSWGGGPGFYLALLSAISISVLIFKDKILKLVNRYE